MAIVKTDLKIMKSERISDTDDGGGRITNNALVSGQENNLFDDISELDRVYGNVSLRKSFAAVNTQNTDIYFGAHAIVSDPPDDPNVHITMFSTEDWDDFRSTAKDYVERYYVRSTKWSGYLLENQLQGQRAIQIWQRLSVELPNIGAVFCLIQDEGKETEFEQYVRVIRILSEIVREYNDAQGAFKVRVLSLEISDPLLYDFEGVAPSRTEVTSKAWMRTTLAADAAKYYGIRSLKENRVGTEMNVVVQDIYSQLVPSTQSETPVIDVGIQSISNISNSSSATVTLTVSHSLGDNISLYLGNGCLPGTFRLTYGTDTITDSGGDLKYNNRNRGWNYSIFPRHSHFQFLLSFNVWK